MLMKNFFVYNPAISEYDFNLSEPVGQTTLDVMDYVDKNLNINVDYARKLFSLPLNGDVVTREFTLTLKGATYSAFLICVEGLSNSEAATIMKKNPRQMKNLVYRAKSALKSELDKEGFVYEEL